MKGPPESSPRENGSVPAQFSRASDIGRDHPGGRAGTAVLRFVLFRRRGDQGVVPTTSVSRNHRQGSCQQHGSRGRRSPRGEPSARGCCERARPRRTGGPPDARRPRMPESCEGRAPAAVEARPRHPMPEAARGFPPFRLRSGRAEQRRSTACEVRRQAAGPHGSQGLPRVANSPAGLSVSTTTTAARSRAIASRD